MQRCSCLSVCCCLHCFFAMDTFIQYFEMLYWSLIVALAKKNFTNKELKKQNKYLNLRGIQRNHDWTYRHVEWSTNPTIFSSSLGKWPKQGRVLKMLVVVGWLVGWSGVETPFEVLPSENAQSSKKLPVGAKTSTWEWTTTKQEEQLCWKKTHCWEKAFPWTGPMTRRAPSGQGGPCPLSV